jgi:hypothetical protein
MEGGGCEEYVGDKGESAVIELLPFVGLTTLSRSQPQMSHRALEVWENI